MGGNSKSISRDFITVLKFLMASCGVVSAGFILIYNSGILSSENNKKLKDHDPMPFSKYYN